MKKSLLNTILIITLFSFLFFSCTDPYVLRTDNYEEAVVIEATITNELKNQEIKVSKTYKFEENGPTLIDDAVVTVTDSDGTVFEFEYDSGRYISISPFQAETGKQYKLLVITDNGRSYTSTNETLTTVNPIQDVVPTVTFKDGIRGVAMNVKSFDPTNTSKYYRYEYEETYKIIAPKWVPVKAIVTYTPPTNPIGTIDLIPRTTEARVCFSSDKSNNLLLTSTNNLNEDRVNFSVRFIKGSDYTIANRYSILVKQYVQNLASYTFYTTLKEISGSGSILSQNQPGFFSGNIKCVENNDEKVIGFFDVSSASSKRIFFNYNDVFPGEALPKYPYKCEINPETPQENVLKFCFLPFDFTCQGYTVLSLLSSGTYVYYSFYDESYEIYPTPCGDCTSFSSNIIPSFWID
ncbi:DUF4249 domain-containing protein [Flavobacterium sp.]|uniref:DUF4249 domain-containing protein n=1 Tax=Flavobacterium sp. TaxID=239 RepID=UPI00375371C4